MTLQGANDTPLASNDTVATEAGGVSFIALDMMSS
jgi:hypothetical protein